ncbi:MAG: hypothetical protein JJU46_10510 [Balneolaceae bacterium]|nr:hypothetical protein [Balneolaceae bacterium]
MSDSNRPEDGAGRQEKKDAGVHYVPVEAGHYGRYEEDDEISLIDLVRTLWEGKRLIILSIIFFGFIGLFNYLFSAREYVSDAIMIQEQRQANIGGNQLLQQFGGGSVTDPRQEGIPTSMYPDIIQSADFLLGVANHEVEFSSLNNKMTPIDYFSDVYQAPLTERTADFLVDYTIKLPITLYRGVRGLFSRDAAEIVTEEGEIEQVDIRFLSLSGAERRAIREIRNRMEIDMSGGLITFSMQMPDPAAAAELNHFIIERLQSYVVNYRISKYRENLRFVEKQKDDARQRYEEAQLELARFNDRNVTITTNVARTQQEDLQNRRNITYNVYNNLAQELEQARTRLQEETPVFNILQKPSLPHNVQSRSELILILTIFVGGVFGVFLVFGVNAWRVIREQIVAK